MAASRHAKGYVCAKDGRDNMPYTCKPGSVTGPPPAEGRARRRTTSMRALPNWPPNTLALSDPSAHMQQAGAYAAARAAASGGRRCVHGGQRRRGHPAAVSMDALSGEVTLVTASGHAFATRALSTLLDDDAHVADPAARPARANVSLQARGAGRRCARGAHVAGPRAADGDVQVNCFRPYRIKGLLGIF